MLTEVGRRVYHPESLEDMGTVIEIGVGRHEGRARIKWDDKTYHNGNVRKGKRTWIAIARLAPAPAKEGVAT